MATIGATSGDSVRAMTWPQIVALVVPISAAIIAGIGVIVFSLNGIHSQTAAIEARTAAYEAESAADRRAWQATMDTFWIEMQRLAARQSHVEGRLDERGSAAD